MTAPLNVMGMAKVLGGWSGALSVTIGASTVAVTPGARTSAVILARAVAVTATSMGVTTQAYASSAGVLTWEALSSISINASGLIRTRLNLAGTTTGTTLTGAGAHTDGFYPEHGMQIRAIPQTTTTVPAAAAGAQTDVPNVAPQSLTIKAFGTLANLWTYEDAFGGDQIWDVWRFDGYWGRLRVDAVIRERFGASAEFGRLNMRGESYLWDVGA